MVKTTIKSKKVIKPVKSDVVEEDVTPEVIKTELDPEILAAISPRRAKKSKTEVIDYIPELERDAADMDADDE